MTKIRKYQIMAFLEVFELKGCKTIEDIKKLLDNDLKNDTDVVFQFRVGARKEDFNVPKNIEVQDVNITD